MARIRDNDNPNGISYIAVRSEKVQTERSDEEFSFVGFLAKMFGALLIGVGIYHVCWLLALLYMHIKYGVMVYVY